MRRFSPWFLLMLLGPSVCAQVPDNAEMSTLKNTSVKVGIDLNRGGAIVFLSRNGRDNLINNFDLGRQVQLSFFSGPSPYSAKGQSPAKHWEHIGWNPIQAGDDYGNASEVLDHRNDGKTIYVKTKPLHWPLNNVPADCTYESWLRLDKTAVVVRARLNNNRTDDSKYPARLQELPAVYANAGFSRVVSYTGSRPFENADVTEIPKSKGKHPWSFWQGTECWSALLDHNDFGLGLVTPCRMYFTGGFAGTPARGDTHANSTGYLSSQRFETLDHNITYNFRYELVPGTLEEIRTRAAMHRQEELPAWIFREDRQGWHCVNTKDNGWPISDSLDVNLDAEDPQILSPFTFWNAKNAPTVTIDCAWKTDSRSAVLYWQRHGATTIAPNDFVRFPIKSDGRFHRYEIKLSESARYRGAMIRLRFDPGEQGGAGDFVRIRSVRF